jgi:putative membrane protein
MKNTFILLIVLFLCTLLGCHNSANKGNQKVDTQKFTPPDGSTILPKENFIVDTDRVDEIFASEASNGEMAELEMGKLAQSKGYNEKVRSLVKMIGYADSVANQRLNNLAAERRILLLADLEKNEQGTLDDLKKRSGKDFDSAFINAMIKAYQKDIKLFEKNLPDLKDQELKQFALQTLPILKTHLLKCQQVYNQLK